MPQETLFEYSFTNEETNFLLQVLDKTQMAWVANVKFLLSVVEKLQNPKNLKDIEESQFNSLKEKFEPKKKDKVINCNNSPWSVNTIEKG